MTMIIAVAAVGCLCFAGGYFVGNSGDSADNTPIFVSGSTTVQPLMGAWASAYEQNNDVAIYVSGGGSGGGRTATSNGTVNIGMASSPTSVAGITQHTICFDAVVIVASSNVSLSNLTINDLKALYMLAGAPAPDTPGLLSMGLEPVVREFGSGTRESVVTAFGLPSESATSRQIGGTERTSTASMLSYINSGNDRIGFVNMNSLAEISGGTNVIYPNVNSMTVNSIEATAENVQEYMTSGGASGYPMSRALFILTKDDGSKMDPATKAFLRWMYSAEAQAIADREGFVHLDPETLKVEAAKILQL